MQNYAAASQARARYLWRSWPAGTILLGTFLGMHASVLLIWGAQAKPVSYVFMMGAPLLASGACLRRARRHRDWQGWGELGLAALLWSAGMATNMSIDLLLSAAGDAPGISMLCYILFGVPLIFTVASSRSEPWYVRAIDGAVAVGLGVLFFVHTFTFAGLDHATAEGASNLRWMFDIENAFVALFATIRWRASIEPVQRTFFAVLTLFGWAYLADAAFTNHVMYDVDFGTLADIVIDAPFLLLAALAARPLKVASTKRLPAQRFELAVRAASPLMLPTTSLIVACVLLARSPRVAIAGFFVATLGYGLRNVLSQMREYAEQIRLDALSRIDALTGLPNRREFDEVLAREWARARRNQTPLAVLVVDIDHFKLLNDGLGHLVGDKRLIRVSRELASCATRASDFVGRYGGEEFVAILSGTSAAAARAVAEKMRKAIEACALATPAPSGVVTVSIGLAATELPGHEDALELLAQADAALYAAKRQGRNRIEQHVRVTS